MTLDNLPGTYKVIGSNQDADSYNYKGILSLSLDRNKRVIAKWLINNTQEQFGTGFFKDNILVINFYYKGENDTTFKGVVVYRCLSNDVLDGFWSEKHGDPNFLGKERCFRNSDPSNTIN